VKIEFDNKENAEKESKVVLKFENEEALHSKENLNINFDEENNEEENDPVKILFYFIYLFYFISIYIIIYIINNHYFYNKL